MHRKYVDICVLCITCQLQSNLYLEQLMHTEYMKLVVVKVDQVKITSHDKHYENWVNSASAYTKAMVRGLSIVSGIAAGSQVFKEV